MVNKVILLRYGEIHLKGKNRGIFENALLKNIESATFSVDGQAKVLKIGGRYVVFGFCQENSNLLVEKLTKVFGLVSLSVAYETENDAEKIIFAVQNFIKTVDFGSVKTFKAEVKRADKCFPVHSTDFEAEIGGVILDIFPNLKVKLSQPDLTVNIDIRENGKTYIFTNKIACAGGLPVGVSGKALVMLSGGIDSPVACYLMAKRGVQIAAIHFHSYPYTSKQAKEKVITLAKEVKDYCGKFKLYCVSFTKIQEEIHKNCKEGYMITIMRRIMMRICEKIALKEGYLAVVTGENLGQVASQTIESMTSTESVLNKIPVFRPVLTYDKLEIIEISKKIGTFETSILPYEDCCTVFLPKNPLIKPKIELVEKEEAKIDIEFLVEQAIKNLEIIEIWGDTYEKI